MGNSSNRTLLLILVLFLSSSALFAQRLKGTVIDEKDGLPIPLVNVYIKGTSEGSTTDFDGKFKIKNTRNLTIRDSIVFSYVGYKVKTIGVKDFKPNSTIKLSDDAESLKTVVLSGKGFTKYEDYLMSQIIRNKRKNNPERITKSQFLETSILSVFLANLNKDIIEKRRFKKSAQAFIKETDSTVMMPILMSKEIKRHRIDEDNNINNEKILDIEQEGTLEQLSSLVKSTINQKITQNVNFYDENIDLLGRSFQSPIGSSYKSYYRMYLADSAMVDGVKQYKFEYYPKNEKSVAFDGHFWFESETFALTEIEATLPTVANVNFIKKLSFEVEYDKTKKDSTWYVKSQKSNTKFSFVNSKKNKESRFFFAQKHQKYSDFQLEFSKTDSLVATTNKSLFNAPISIDMDNNTTELDSLELNAIKGIRTLKDNGWIKFLDRFGAMTLNGYYNLNKFDLGPYFDFYLKNGIEGSRLTLPLRTSAKFSEKFTVGGYVGYGTKDKDWKYGLETKFLLSNEKRTVLSAKYYDDFRTIAANRYIEFVQENPYSRGGGNILSVFANEDKLNFRMLRQKHLDVTLTHEATENARYLFRPFYERFEDNVFNSLTHNGVNQGGFRTLGMLVNLRYSKARNFDQQFFSRIYFGTTKPVYHLTAEVGHNKIINSPNNNEYSAFYARLNASMKKKFLLGSTFIKMYANAGYVLGKVPYPILNNPSGNQSLGLARFNYNLLNPTSFSSDVYANLHLSFNGGGFLFNKIPLLDRLNIRESMSFKAFYGKLNNNHNEFFELPSDLVELQDTPYMELGVGVANIFKVLRIEYVRRLNSGTFYDAISEKGGLKLRIEVSF